MATVSASATNTADEESTGTVVPDAAVPDTDRSTYTPISVPSSGENLIGKINNLITTDVQTIVNMRNIMLTSVFTPISIIVSVYYLYTLLGWRHVHDSQVCRTTFH